VAAEFSIRRRVQFAETDMAGIMHFAQYFRWMEEVEHAFFRSLGLSVVMKHEGVELGWPRVATSCEYFGPARFEEEVELTLRVTKVGEKSLNYEVAFMRGATRLALGKLTSVCCEVPEPGKLRAIAIPAAIREKLMG
jgi:acyl-CoA thioester hydrolase